MTPFWKTGVKFWLWLAVFAVAGLVYGSRLWLVRTYGSDVPYMDQWDAQGQVLYAARDEGRLSVSDFWLPHNEHRLVLTKVLAYTLTYGNGQWDPLLEMTVNAGFFAGLAGLLGLLAWRQLRGFEARAKVWAWAWTVGVVGALFCLPFAWENTLQGFQSQFILAELAAVGGLWLAAPALPLSARWWAGVGFGVLGLGIMSSGFLTLAALLVVLVARQAWCERRWSWPTALAAGLLLLFCLLGMQLVRHVPGHDGLRAASVGEGLRALLCSLAWPANRWLGWAVLLQAPSLLVLSRAIWRRRLESTDAVILGVVGWCWLQLVALAYARGHDLMVTSPRYLDLDALLVAVNALALARLWLERWSGWSAAGVVCWSVVLGWGLHTQTVAAYTNYLDGFAAKRTVERQHLRAFIRSGDWPRLAQAPVPELPYPSAEVLRQSLSHPGIRALLPVGLRPALSLVPTGDSFGFGQMAPAAVAGCPDGWVWQARTGPARFISEPLPAERLPVLRLVFMGPRDLDPSAIRLEAADGTRVPLAVRRFAEDRWQTAQLAMPVGHGPVRLVVETPAGRYPLAFADPVEMGLWSWYAHHVRKSAQAILWGSAGLLALAFWMLARGTVGSRAVRRPQPIRTNTPLRAWLGSLRACAARGWQKAAPFLLWYLGGGLVLLASCLPILWPAYFTTPLPAQPTTLLWLRRVALFALIPLATLVLFRTYEGRRTEKWGFIVLAVLGACFCEQILHQFVDKGHYFGAPANTDIQRELQGSVIALDPRHVPHSYRFFSHGIVELFTWFGGSFEVGRAAYRLLFNALLCGAILRYARLFLPALYAGATLLLLLLLYPITVAWFAGQFVDPASHLSFVACLYFIQTGFEPGFAPALFVGVFAKESVAVMAVARFFGHSSRWRAAVATLLYFLLALSGLLAIRLWVNQGAMQYQNISGVGTGQVLANLKGWDEWIPQYVFSLGVLLPGAALGWRLMSRNYRWITGLLGVSLVVTSAMFSWLNEVRNLFPAMIMLAIVNLRYVQSRISPDTPA